MPKQLQIAGTERPHHPDVDTAAEAYIKARDERIALSAVESEANDALIDAMGTHKLTIYKDEGRNVIVTIVPGKPNVKVTDATSTDEG